MNDKAAKPEPSIAEIAEKLKDKFLSVASEVANDVDTSAVLDLVIKDLNASKREVALRLMGLRNTWGQWEVDTGSGRSAIVGSLLTEETKKIASDWVNQAIAEALTPATKDKIQRQIKASIKRELLEVSGYQIDRKIKERAEHLMDDYINIVAKELRTELNLPEKD